MALTPPCYRFVLTSSVLILLCQGIITPLRAQLPLKDSAVRQQFNALKSSVRTAAARPFSDSSLPQQISLFSRPAFKLTGGYISYNFNYRSIIDTPYAERDVMQHNVTGRFDMTVAGAIPLQVNYRLRQTNSNFFRNLADVQVSFNGAEFRNKLQSAARSRLMALAPSLKDSLLEKLYELKQLEQLELAKELKNKFHPQKLVEANEILNVPRITWQTKVPDSLNIAREDSMKKLAAGFLDLYTKTKQRYDHLNHQVDSLKKLYDKNLKKINQYKQLISGRWEQSLTPQKVRDTLKAYGINENPIPPAYRWLMNVRSFSIGRSQVNYSELTAKNLSVNGINFEYNSWYYFAVTAGTVNYRFRDFVINGSNKKPQYLYMIRAGLGRIEKNYFILSAFRGQKQLFRTGATGNTTTSISGVSAETRWAINRNTWVTAELAKSIAPDYRNIPAENKTRLTFSDHTNQALALKAYTYWPQTGSRVEAFYKKTGANFQSFSSFQTSSALESWYIKAEQSFFNRKLRLAGSLRKNEFTNPFIAQQYFSNTVFKSLTASLRVRKWPVVTVGYQPLSQLTKVDNQVLENRFQTFNATGYHQYAIKQLRMATTVMWNKFYNNSADTGFVYYNAVNTYVMQSFFFPAFTANMGASFTKNSSYNLQVLDGYVQPNISRLGTIGLGIKLNNMNGADIKAGGYINASIHIYKQDVLMLGYEHGYLPGIRGTLVRNAIGTVQFIKTFNFR